MYLSLSSLNPRDDTVQSFVRYSNSKLSNENLEQLPVQVLFGTSDRLSTFNVVDSQLCSDLYVRFLYVVCNCTSTAIQHCYG